MPLFNLLNVIVTMQAQIERYIMSQYPYYIHPFEYYLAETNPRWTNGDYLYLKDF